MCNTHPEDSSDHRDFQIRFEHMYVCILLSRVHLDVRFALRGELTRATARTTLEEMQLSECSRPNVVVQVKHKDFVCESRMVQSASSEVSRI